MKTPIFCPHRAARLALVGLCLAGFARPAAADPRHSNHYSQPTESLNGGGSAGSSPTYANVGGLGMVGGAASSPAYRADSGFPAATQDTPPTLTLPASPLVVEASGPGGAMVSFTSTASDPEDGILVPTSTPPSGSLFALGNTTVLVQATDRAGHTVTGSFLVRVRDTTPPVVTVPPNSTVQATSPAGAVVAFAPTASDAVGVTSLLSVPASGSTFPIGTTTVTTSAKDAANNTGTGTFTLTVLAQVTAPPISAGDDVPGAGIVGSGVPGGAKWRTFGIPGIDDGAPGGEAGAPVFLGTFDSPTANPKKPLTATGIFGLGGIKALVAKSGDLAADTDQGTFASFSEPVGNHGTAFIAKVLDKDGKLVDATAEGLWSNAFPDTDGRLHGVARVGSPAADTGLKYKAIDSVALNDGQNLFWSATLTGPGATKDALFLQSSRAAGARVVLQTGDAISGLPGLTVKSFIALHEGGNGGLAGVTAGSGTGRPNGGATTPVLITFSDGTTAIFKVGLNVLGFIARTGTATPDVANGDWNTLGLPAAAGSTVAFRAILKARAKTKDVTKDNEAAIYAVGAGRALAAIARQGADPVGDGRHEFLGFSDPAVNANGDVQFFAQLAGPSGKTTALCLARRAGGTYVTRVLHELGGEAPGIPGVILSQFLGAALPQNFDPAVAQYPVFAATLKSGATKVKSEDNTALFAYDSHGVARLLVRTGLQTGGKTLDTIDAFSFVLASPSQSRATASDSRVIYRATYTDKTQAVVEVPMP